MFGGGGGGMWARRRRRASAAQRLDGNRGSDPIVSAGSAGPVGKRRPSLVDSPVAVLSCVKRDLESLASTSGAWSALRVHLL
jgi:hypothetical protein